MFPLVWSDTVFNYFFRARESFQNMPPSSQTNLLVHGFNFFVETLRDTFLTTSLVSILIYI